MPTEPRPIRLELNYSEAVELEVALLERTARRNIAADPEAAELAQRIRLEHVSPHVIRAERGEPDPLDEERRHRRLGATIILALGAGIIAALVWGFDPAVFAAIIAGLSYRAGWSDASR